MANTSSGGAIEEKISEYEVDDDVNSDSDVEEDRKSLSRLQSLPRVASAIWNSTAIEEEAAQNLSVRSLINK